MSPLTSLLILVGTVVVCSSASSKFEPSVAFVCDRGAMHMHEDGTWGADPDTDCMEGKKEILEYCKKSYPALDVTNIVESSDHKHIAGWCALGKSNCGTSEAFKVRPFRCLTGPFQSDALIVPKDCKFDHVHQPKQCHGFSWWSDVAHKACRGIQHMKTENFAMLLPCGTDVFTGVEYVCCPDGSNSTVEAVEEKPTIGIKVEPAPKSVSKSKIGDVKIVDNYLHMKESAYKDNEHDAFELAKKELTKDNHDKITKLMKDWAEARKRVLDLKEFDPKGAEKMNKEITPRFQKEYFALQATGDSKILQLDAVHQQHVQANLDGKKRKTVEKLMSELQDDQPEPATISKLLKRYISIEEKDAHHCIRHYTKIRDRDAANGRELLPTTLTHLTLISARINQSIGLLDTLDSDSMKDKILVEVKAWRSKTFNSINKYIEELKKELLANPATKPPRVTDAPKVVDVSEDKLEVVDKKPTIKVLNIKPAKPVKSDKKTDSPKGTYKQFADKYAAKVESKGKPATPLKKVYDEEDEKENEHSYKKLISPKVQVNHMASGGSLVANSNSFGSMSASSTSTSAGVGIGITIGVVAGVLVVVLSIVLVKKRMDGGKPSKDSYLEVSVEDNTLSAEERHIASMQRGFENPTYKYLEKQGI